MSTEAAAAGLPRKTILNAVHRAANARMVDFAGWDMPLHYGSQIEEHHAVRRHVGMFDVSHMCALEIQGQDARSLLSRLLANDVAKLRQPGKALYSVMLNADAGVIDDLIVYFLATERFRLVVNAATAHTDLEWMQRYRADSALRVEIHAWRQDLLPDGESRALAMIALQGPAAAAKLAAAMPEATAACDSLGAFAACEFASRYGPVLLARTGYTGEDGFEIMVEAAQAVSLWQALRTVGVPPCGLAARDTLRLEAGMPLYGHEMDATVSPLDAGLGWTVVSDTPRDFVGKTALLQRGQQHQLRGLILEERGVLRAGQRVFCAQGQGIICSGSYSPTLQRSIALARLPPGLELGTMVEVAIRDKRLPARLCQPRFVRHGQAL